MSSLNPLKYCRPDLAFYFSKFMLHLGILDCRAVIDANIFLSCSSAPSVSSSPTTHQLTSMLLDSGFDFLFFSPFQPYVLPICRDRLMVQYLHICATPVAPFTDVAVTASSTVQPQLSFSHLSNLSLQETTDVDQIDRDNLESEEDLVKDVPSEILKASIDLDNELTSDSDESPAAQESPQKAVSAASDSFLGKRNRRGLAPRANMLRVCLFYGYNGKKTF